MLQLKPTPLPTGLQLSAVLPLLQVPIATVPVTQAINATPLPTVQTCAPLAPEPDTQCASAFAADIECICGLMYLIIKSAFKIVESTEFLNSERYSPHLLI